MARPTFRRLDTTDPVYDVLVDGVPIGTVERTWLGTWAAVTADDRQVDTFYRTRADAAGALLRAVDPGPAERDRLLDLAAAARDARDAAEAAYTAALTACIATGMTAVQVGAALARRPQLTTPERR